MTDSRAGRRWRLAAALWAAIAAGALTLAAQPRATRPAPLTGLATITRIYGQVLDADFDGAEAGIETCAEAPREACDVLEATRVWWRVLLDPESMALDPAFEQRADRAIETTTAWTTREPASAEAWFYLGGAYGARAQWRVLRVQRLAAARDGKRIKEALERAVALDPTLEDAHFGIGLYQYYADVAPSAAKFLRMLLLLPGGDRKEGMRRMLRARERGQVLRGEADYQLHVIDLWYEQNFPRALQLLRGLEQAHPRNPLFAQLIAEVQDVYFHDRTASLAAWRAIIDRASRGALNEAPAAVARARLGAAAQLDALEETDAAVELLRPLAVSRPAAPFGATAKALLQLGLGLDRLGQRADAVPLLNAAIAAVPAGDPHGVRPRAEEALRRPADPVTARAYRLALEGWRALEHGDAAAAEQALREAVTLRPADPVGRYRLGRALMARGDEHAALQELERAMAASPLPPPTFYAAACLSAGSLLERAGERARAIELYDRAASVFGASAETKDAAARNAARLKRGRGR